MKIEASELSLAIALRCIGEDRLANKLIAHGTRWLPIMSYEVTDPDLYQRLIVQLTIDKLQS